MILVRKTLVVFLLSQVLNIAFGQDLVVTSKGDSIRCLITEVNSTQLYFSHKTSEGVRHAIMPLGLIKDYKKDFYKGDTSLAAAIAEEKALQTIVTTQVPARTVTTGYYDLIAKKNGDSLNCEILRELPGLLQYRYKIGGTWFRSEISRAEVADFRYKWFHSSTGGTSNQTVEFSLNVGLGYRTGRIAGDLEEHLKGLRTGLLLSTGLTFYTPKNIGFGVRAIRHSASQTTSNVTVYDWATGYSATGTLDDNIKTFFLGPMLRFRNFDDYRGDAAIFGIGIGRLGYRNDASFINDFTITGKTLGVVLDLSYDIPIGQTKKNYFGFTLSYTAGTLTELDITVGTNTQTVQLEENEYDNLSRLDFTLGFRFGN